MKKTTYQQPATQQVRLQHQQMLMEASGAVPGNQVTSTKQGYESKQPTSDWD